MATPGYPQMGHGQGPMMGGMPPMQPMPPTRGPRRGTSRAVPVVVSAGLAVGVFCGLLFGLGTGDKADAKPSTGNNLKHEAEGKVDPNGAPAGLGASTVKPVNDGKLIGSNAPVAAAGSGSAGGGIGSAVVAMAGAGSGSAAVAAKAMKITIEIDPDAAATTAAIKIDGKPITGKTADIAADTKQVHVQITADGYHSIDENVDVSGASGDEHDVKIKMLKRAGGGAGSPGFGGASSGGNHIPTAPPKLPPKKPNQGIIDI